MYLVYAKGKSFRLFWLVLKLEIVISLNLFICRSVWQKFYCQEGWWRKSKQISNPQNDISHFINNPIFRLDTCGCSLPSLPFRQKAHFIHTFCGCFWVEKFRVFPFYSSSFASFFLHRENILFTFRCFIFVPGKWCKKAKFEMRFRLQKVFFIVEHAKNLCASVRLWIPIMKKGVFCCFDLDVIAFQSNTRSFQPTRNLE